MRHKIAAEGMHYHKCLRSTGYPPRNTIEQIAKAPRRSKDKTVRKLRHLKVAMHTVELEPKYRLRFREDTYPKNT